MSLLDDCLCYDGASGGGVGASLAARVTVPATRVVVAVGSGTGALPPEPDTAAPTIAVPVLPPVRPVVIRVHPSW